LAFQKSKNFRLRRQKRKKSGFFSSRFSKFLPAALKKEEICRVGSPKIRKFSPAAL